MHQSDKVKIPSGGMSPVSRLEKIERLLENEDFALIFQAELEKRFGEAETELRTASLENLPSARAQWVILDELRNFLTNQQETLRSKLTDQTKPLKASQS